MKNVLTSHVPPPHAWRGLVQAAEGFEGSFLRPRPKLLAFGLLALLLVLETTQAHRQRFPQGWVDCAACLKLFHLEYLRFDVSIFL
jgi:hypothetical protein